jgi:prepilin-type N-terminal cleavage/methylation domain-containing protein
MDTFVWGLGGTVHRRLAVVFSARRSRGFSLVEVVLVLAVVSVLAAVAVPRFTDFLARQRLDAACRRVVADLDYARRMARYLSKSRTVKFNVAQGEYSLTGVPDLDRPASTYTISLRKDPYEASILSVDIGGDTEITFNGFGTPDSGGTIRLLVGGQQKTITVDADTGRATIP